NLGIQAYPDIGTSLSYAISSAGTSPSSYQGQPPGYVGLLKQIGTNNQWIPDSTRTGITNVIQTHIADFGTTPPSHDGSWSWQDQAFNAAEATRDGHVIWSNVNTIQASIVANHPMPADPPNQANQAEWRSWSEQNGNLYGLSAFPI